MKLSCGGLAQQVLTHQSGVGLDQLCIILDGDGAGASDCETCAGTVDGLTARGGGYGVFSCFF